MAPRTNTSTRKSARRSGNSRQQRHEKIVRFPKKEPPLKRKSSTAVKPPENYESLILYYLAKLRRLFSSADHPTPGNRENSAAKMRKENNGNTGRQEEPQSINPNRYTARHSSPRPRDNLSAELKEQALNIVNAAIEYGYANNVVGRNGNCFYLKGTKSCKGLSLNPVPESRCGCRQCFSRMSTNHVEVLKAPATQNPNGDFVRVTRAMADGSKRYYLPNKQHFRNMPTRTSSCINPVATKSGRVNKVCRCSKCCALHPLKEHTDS
ncbi:unnamed protein product [Callosobruchus maculatus]|uniref:Uncharacterized protein n=1 Tax=Callosobruchus maculatus TaxID=64391 RepID=A0A653CC59_CALMS|nr:unnamed protein product [Callosobruchus maculatus]